MDIKRLEFAFKYYSNEDLNQFKLNNREEYINFQKNHENKEALRKIIRKRVVREYKIKRLYNHITKNPDILDYLKAIFDYRNLRVEQYYTSTQIHKQYLDPDELASFKINYSFLDKKRRSVHNLALKAFCNLVEKTSSSLTNRNNEQDPNSNLYFEKRSELNSLYQGKLMNPLEENNNYGDPKIREEMTNGMFQLLSDIESYPTQDLILLQTKELNELSQTLKSSTRGWGMDEPPENDDFNPEQLFKNNKDINQRY